MLADLVARLNREQREKLDEFGVDDSTLSRWRTGKRLPTEPQAKFLCELLGANYHQLADEIANLRATPEQRALLERVMGKARGVVAAMLIFGVSVAVGGAALGALSTSGLRALFWWRKKSTMCVM